MHDMPDAEDRRGMARVRCPAAASSVVDQPSDADAGPSAELDLQTQEGLPVVIVVEAPQLTAMSRTTAWRKRKKEAEAGEQSRTPRCPVARKVYSCRVCGRPMTSEGHTQFRGQRYCAQTPGIAPQDEWLRQKRLEAASKKN